MSEHGFNWRGSEQTVTASGLVRQFGTWQEAACRAPVYILHRGRARLVLASVEMMGALCAPHRDDAIRLAARERALLDALADPALIVDETLRLVAVGRAARGYFGAHAVEQADLAAILPNDIAPFVTSAVGRVIASGFGERLELRSAAHGHRRLDLSIDPVPGGVLLTGHDRGVEDQRDAAVAGDAAKTAALAALTGIASATVGPRGYLHDSGSLPALTGLSPQALASVRFVALFDVASRVAVGEALESVFEDRRTRSIDAGLLVNRAPPLPVRIAIAACRGDAVVLVSATGFRDA